MGVDLQPETGTGILTSTWLPALKAIVYIDFNSNAWVPAAPLIYETRILTLTPDTFGSADTLFGVLNAEEVRDFRSEMHCFDVYF